MRRIALPLVASLVLAAVMARGRQPSAGPAFQPRPSRITEGTAAGRAILVRNQLQAAAIGSYELRVTIGAGGVATGGGLLIGFPKAWFTNPYPIPKHLQTTQRERPHFLAIASSRSGSAFDVRIDITSFTGKVERFNQTISAINIGSPLQPGDVVSVTLENTTAPYLAGDDVIAVAIDADATGRFKPMERGAAYTVAPGPAEDFTLLAPTEAVVGRPVDLQITAFDRYWNVADRFAGSFQVTGLGSTRTVRLSAANHGLTTFKWTPGKEGFYFPDAGAFKGNPIRVFSKDPPTRTYWGELHSHSSISADGIGKDPFPYARDAARLDFFAATEHADDDGNTPGSAIRPEDWEWLKDRVRRFNAPGRFVTLLAYECSFPAPYGHHNVFFRSMEGAPWPAKLMGSVQNLWAQIRAGDALTIPHHTGILFAGPPPGADAAGPGLQPIISSLTSPVTAAGAAVDWTIHDAARRPLLEIYSLHGSSEIYNPDDSLAYEQSRYTFGRSVPGPHYARDAWAAGLELGLVAASDNHFAQPGQPHGGTTAVRAPTLTREAIFGGLSAKQTYATTGQRIYMDVAISGVQMGQTRTVSGPVLAQITVAAPSSIAHAELVRRDLPTGDYIVVAQWNNAGRLLQATAQDAPTGPRAMYYFRLELEEQIRGRPVRAWSSPVWLEFAAAQRTG